MHYPSDELPPPLPVITGIAPDSAAAGSGQLTLAVNGGGFTSTSEVFYDDAAVPTTFVNATALTATIDPVAPAGVKVVRVRDGQRDSNTVDFTVLP